MLYYIICECACVGRACVPAHMHTLMRARTDRDPCLPCYTQLEQNTHTHTAPQTAQTRQGHGHGQNSHWHAPDPTYRTLFPPTDVGTPVCVCPCSAETAATALVVACLLRFRLRPLVKQR